MIFSCGFGHSAHMKLTLSSGDQKLLKDLCRNILRDILDFKGIVNVTFCDFIHFFYLFFISSHFSFC